MLLASPLAAVALLWVIIATAVAKTDNAHTEPQDICFLTDHAPVPDGTCGHLARLIISSADKLKKAHVRKHKVKTDASKKGAAAHALKKALNGLHGELLDYFTTRLVPTELLGIRERLNDYNQIVPCLNRYYACEQGYNFIMPSSPELSIVQKTLEANGPADLQQELRTMSKLCGKSNITLPKGWTGNVYDEERRSFTWCKVVLLQHMLTQPHWSPCKVIVFLDGDLLLIPPNQVGTGQQLREAIKVNADPSTVNSPKEEEAMIKEFHHSECRGKPDATTGLYGRDSPCTSPLHLQPEIRHFLRRGGAGVYFLSRTLGGIALGHDQFDPKDLAMQLPKAERDRLILRNELQPINNVNNTVHSTSFIVVKNGAAARAIAEDWWRSVDPGRELLSPRGEPLRIYRSAWAHEQRVFDDYIAVKYPDAVAVAKRGMTYNSPMGVFAQHYWQKVAHLRQYLAVAVGYWSDLPHGVEACGLPAWATAGRATAGGASNGTVQAYPMMESELYIKKGMVFKRVNGVTYRRAATSRDYELLQKTEGAASVSEGASKTRVIVMHDAAGIKIPRNTASELAAGIIKSNSRAELAHTAALAKAAAVKGNRARQVIDRR